MRKTLHILTDLDGVFCRHPRYAAADWQSKSELFTHLARWQAAGVDLVFTPVTNRPGSHLQMLCYDLHIAARVCITECGAAGYNPYHHAVIVNPLCIPYCQNVRPALLAQLRQQLRLGPGQRFQEDTAYHVAISLSVLGSDRDRGELEVVLTKVIDQFATDARLELAKTAVIHPRGCDKAAGMQWLEEMYGRRTSRAWPWRDTVWVADGVRDITAAQYVHSRGGMVSAVGGSDDAYAECVRQLNGYVAADAYERGVVQIVRWALDN